MYPLIEIKSIPIEIRMKTTNASLEYTRGTAEMEISRSDKGLDIKSRPIKLQLDTFEPRAGHRPGIMPQGVSQPQQEQQADLQTSYEATSAYSDQGQIMLNARFGQELLREAAPAAAESAAAPQAEDDALKQDLGVNFDFDWESGQMEIRYEMDKLNFDWKIDKGEFEFTPGDIEITVEQQPSVVIKYTGGPIYVPRSADPNYEPVDVKA